LLGSIYHLFFNIVDRKWVITAIFGPEGFGRAFILEGPCWWILICQLGEFDLSKGDLTVEDVEALSPDGDGGSESG
jgi:hypothetical protein